MYPKGRFIALFFPLFLVLRTLPVTSSPNNSDDLRFTLKDRMNDNGPYDSLQMYLKGQEEFAKLKHWYCQVVNTKFSDDEDARKKLVKEACKDEETYQKTELGNDDCSKWMCEGLKIAEEKYVHGVSQKQRVVSEAERLALTMYTTDFCWVYNDDLRNGRTDKYPVFNALLHSALKKLSKNLKNSQMYLYRGLLIQIRSMGSTGFFFKTYSSTTLNLNVAASFSKWENGGKKGEILTFRIDHPTEIIAGNIKDFSTYSDEDEILLSPFNEFQMVNNDMHTLRESYFQYFDKNYKC